MNKNCLNCGNFLKREPCNKCMVLDFIYKEWRKKNIFDSIRIKLIKLIKGVV